MIIKGIDFSQNDTVLISGSPDYKCDFMNCKNRNISLFNFSMVFLLICIILYYILSFKNWLYNK